MPVIKLSHHADIHLTAWAIATNGKEFSGLGLIEKEGDVFHVVDVFLLGVGSEMYTEFNHERQRALGADPRLKLWFHRHPIGSGNVGDPGNWSGTDERTATKEPMGVDPKLVQWSCAIVLTPGGWVGRVDLHVPKLKIFHCAVEPRIPTPETVEEAKTLITPELEEYIDVLLREFHALRNRRFPQQSTYYSRYELDDAFDDWAFDPRDYSGVGLYCAEKDCARMNVELIEGDAEVLYSIDLMVESYFCPKCGQLYYTQKTDDAIEIRVNEQPKRQPAWRQSFMKFLNKRR
jgi:hypothetical protein